MLDRPGLEAAVYGSISSQVVEWVASGFCDVGFAQGPLDFPNIEVELMAPVAGVAVLPEGHRLAEKPVLEPPDFIGEPFVSLEQTTPMRYRIDAIFSAAGITRQTRVETPLSMIACGLVAAGAGVAIVDAFTAFEFGGRGIVVRPFRPAVLYDVGIVWASGRFRSALALDFAGEVRAAVAERSRAGAAPAAGPSTGG